MSNESFYKRLSQLFRSGPAIRRKIKGQNYDLYDTKVVHSNYGSNGAMFKRENSPFSTMGTYGLLDRMTRYQEFSEMDLTTPEIAGALDLYADEACSGDEHGKCFHVYSDNNQVQNALEELFYEVYNIEFEARRDIRNLVKNGDFFRYVEVVPDHGVVSVHPLPVNEVEREEAFDPKDPYAVRFKLLTSSKKFENWQMLHFRILGSELFYPYGSSFLEAARRVWRVLTMIEDSMLLYRVARSPERRVFYIDTSGVHPNDIPTFMEAAKEAIRGRSIIDKLNGRQDFRFNPLDLMDDFFIPTRPNSSTKIETLAAGQNITATEDVEYMQKKLIAALKVPRAFLTFDESLCLDGNTTIPLLDGSNPTIKQLSERFRAKELTEAWCYSTLLDGSVVPGKIVNAWETKHVTETIRVTLDNGEVISCTNNHPFLLRDGCYKRADELILGESLMPVYRRHSNKQQGDLLNGYEQVFDNHTQTWEYTHKLVARWSAVKTRGGYTVGKQRVIHHVDFNKTNNTPNNLREMTWYSHRKLHSQLVHLTILRPDVVAKREPNRLKALRSLKHRQLKSQQLRLQMSDPNSLMRKWVASNELKQLTSKNIKKLWENEEYRKTQSVKNKEILTRPEVRKKLFGRNHWAARKTSRFNLGWLIDYCKQNNVTEFKWFKQSKNNKAPCSSRVIKRIFKDEAIHGWRQFSLQHLSNNHKIVKLERVVGPSRPVFDLEVSETHNFLVGAGVVVHNSSKATLAMEDIRFSRTVANLQKIVIAELNKLAILHLYAKGFTGPALLDFELRFSNPSTVALQQKIALVGTKLETASKAWDLAKETGMMDMEYIQREILGFRLEDIMKMRIGAQQDQKRVAELKALAEQTPDGFNEVDAVVDGSYDYNGVTGTTPDALVVASGSNNNHLPQKPPRSGDGKSKKTVSPTDVGLAAPVNPNMSPKAVSPDFLSMLDVANNRYSKDLYDTEFLKKPLQEIMWTKPCLIIEGTRGVPHGISKDITSALKRFDEAMRPNSQTSSLIVEANNKTEEENNFELVVDEDDDTSSTTTTVKTEHDESLGLDKWYDQYNKRREDT